MPFSVQLLPDVNSIVPCLHLGPSPTSMHDIKKEVGMVGSAFLFGVNDFVPSLQLGPSPSAVSDIKKETVVVGCDFTAGSRVHWAGLPDCNHLLTLQADTALAMTPPPMFLVGLCMVCVCRTRTVELLRCWYVSFSDAIQQGSHSKTCML